MEPTPPSSAAVVDDRQSAAVGRRKALLHLPHRVSLVAGLLFWPAFLIALRDGPTVTLAYRIAVASVAAAIAGALVSLLVTYFRAQLRVVALIAVGTAALAVAALFTALTHYASYGTPRCPRNLKQMGMGLIVHANDHGGVLPVNLWEIVWTADIKPEVLVCPGSDHEPARGKSRAELEAAFRTGRHVSYVYVAAGRKADEMRADELVAYEPPEHHDGEGANVLFGDGHVEWMLAGALDKLLAEMRERTPSTRPETARTAAAR